MQALVTSSATHVLRFDRGEEVITGIQSYCAKHGIHAASFSAIGAAGRLTLSWYELASKTYHDHSYAGEYEIICITGNVGTLGGEMAVHAHGAFSDHTMQPVSGHMKECVVSLTCEVVLHILPGTLKRQKDEGTGLNLLA